VIQAVQVPPNFDMEPELEKWMERGEAPERVIASKPASKQPFSRPLCMSPKTAHYSGAGSTNDAANFTCKCPSARSTRLPCPPSDRVQDPR
jgi:hypothetical protein